MRRRHVGIGLAGSLLLAAAIVGVMKFNRVATPATAFDTTTLGSTLDSLPQQAGTPPALRLDTGLTPPTNKWFSSLVFAKNPVPVYAHPISYKPAATGFEMSYPSAHATADSYFQSHQTAVTTGFDAASYQVERYDDLSVTVDYRDAAGQSVAAATIAHGSPAVSVQARRDLPVGVTFGEGATRLSDDYYTVTYAGRRYGVIADAAITRRDQTLHFTVPTDRFFTIFALPDGGDPLALKAAAHTPIIKTSTTVSGNTTTFGLTTPGSKLTLFATLPHQAVSGPATGTYQSPYGPMTLRQGTGFSYSLAAPQLADRLSLEKLTKTERDELQAQVVADAKNTSPTKPDSYFGGKELYRAAQLLDLAKQLGMKTEARTLTAQLNAAFDQWLSGKPGAQRSFYYDTVFKGVVGVQPSFGSEQFNDHHFHYGYFIHAAAILARHDGAFMGKHRAMIDVLAADIAHTQQTGQLPRLRSFDPYTGHSWASGTGDFGDGNNQESVSEAINAWYGLWLWAEASDNPALAAHSQWLYQHETQAALKYWFLQDNPAPAGYNHPVVSLVWGGKRDFATFFSPRPQAMLGIQLIPMSPANNYLAATADRAPAILGAIAPTSADYHGQFGDYLLMYKSLFNPGEALTQARQLPVTAVDDGNSRAYLLAWIMAR